MFYWKGIKNSSSLTGSTKKKKKKMQTKMNPPLITVEAEMLSFIKLLEFNTEPLLEELL